MATFDGLSKRIVNLEDLCASLGLVEDGQDFILNQMFAENESWSRFWGSIADRVHSTGTTYNLTALSDQELAELKKWLLLVKERQMGVEA